MFKCWYPLHRFVFFYKKPERSSNCISHLLENKQKITWLSIKIRIPLIAFLTKEKHKNILNVSSNILKTEYRNKSKYKFYYNIEANAGPAGGNSVYYHDIRVQPNMYYMLQVRGFNCVGSGNPFINFNICLRRDCNHCSTMWITGAVTNTCLTCPTCGNVTYLSYWLYNNTCGYIEGPINYYV
jgi:hypothetical protein